MGYVSYTSEIDFKRDSPDCVVFYLWVKPETFGRATPLRSLLDQDDEMGFAWAGWPVSIQNAGPSISTHRVKVLTQRR